MSLPAQCQPNAPARLEHVFVYGTLKRGQCRERCWPRTPVRIEPAWTLGSLRDLGPYPALLVGSDRVLGELWSFEPRDILDVLTVLDQIEGTDQPGLPNEYDRVQVHVTSLAKWEAVASTYCYADQSIVARLQPLPANYLMEGQPYVQWPRHNPHARSTR